MFQLLDFYSNELTIGSAQAKKAKEENNNGLHV
jgi:hypothetical protein